LGQEGRSPSPAGPGSVDEAAGAEARSITPLEEGSYFCAYASLVHQKDMLEDEMRMDAYHDAILGNAENFAGKVVLDVGCGTGVLALFAAKAGAKKVYAVEATLSADLARILIKGNKVEDVVTVIQSTVEEVELPEKVDIIVSEFMGHFLLRESMIDSVIFARDKFLKSDGAMYPSHAKMVMAPVRSERCMDYFRRSRSRELAEWDEVLSAAKRNYAIDFGCLSQEYERELRNDSLGTSATVQLDADEVVAAPSCVKVLDLLHCTLDDVNGVRGFSCDFELDGNSPSFCQGDRQVTMFAGWFVAEFNGSPRNPSLVQVDCDCSPFSPGETHWGQEIFTLPKPICLDRYDRIECRVEMARSEANWRLYNVWITHTPWSSSSKERGETRCERYSLD